MGKHLAINTLDTAMIAQGGSIVVRVMPVSRGLRQFVAWIKLQLKRK